MIRHCISLFLKEQNEKAYQFYVTDALKIIAENTARFAGGETLTRRFADIQRENENRPKKKEKTAEEVVSGIDKKLKAIREGK